MTKAQVHIGSVGYPVLVSSLPPREPFRLTLQMTLSAVGKAVTPYSTYIHDKVMVMHREHVAAGGRGHPPRTSLLLSRLNELSSLGMLKKSSYPVGLYGYFWEITDAGRAALSRDAPLQSRLLAR